MKEQEEARVAEVGKQLSLCFDSIELREQPCLPHPGFIESLAVMPLSRSKVIAFPKLKKSSVEVDLLARILQRSRLFK